MLSAVLEKRLFTNVHKKYQRPWMIYLLIAILTTPAPVWGDSFPGKGSREKWEEAARYSKQGVQDAGKSDFEAAKNAFKKAISIYDQDPSFYHNLGYIYRKTGQLDQAEHFYKEALKVDADYGRAWMNLGWVYDAQNKTEASLEAYKKASKCSLAPKDKADVASFIDELESKMASSRGKDFYKKAKYNEALTDLERAVALDNKNGQAYYLRGKVYEKLGKTGNAQADFARSKELDYKPKQGE